MLNFRSSQPEVLSAQERDQLGVEQLQGDIKDILSYYFPSSTRFQHEIDLCSALLYGWVSRATDIGTPGEEMASVTPQVLTPLQITLHKRGDSPTHPMFRASRHQVEGKEAPSGSKPAHSSGIATSGPESQFPISDPSPSLQSDHSDTTTIVLPIRESVPPTTAFVWPILSYLPNYLRYYFNRFQLEEVSEDLPLIQRLRAHLRNILLCVIPQAMNRLFSHLHWANNLVFLLAGLYVSIPARFLGIVYRQPNPASELAVLFGALGHITIVLGIIRLFLRYRYLLQGPYTLLRQTTVHIVHSVGMLFRAVAQRFSSLHSDSDREEVGSMDTQPSSSATTADMQHDGDGENCVSVDSDDGQQGGYHDDPDEYNDDDDSDSVYSLSAQFEAAQEQQKQQKQQQQQNDRLDSMQQDRGADDQDDYSHHHPIQLTIAPTLIKAKCSICFTRAQATTATLCGHIFCWNCIIHFITAKKECPMCRAACLPSQLLRLHQFG